MLFLAHLTLSRPVRWLEFLFLVAFLLRGLARSTVYVGFYNYLQLT